jgi:hypothetical protein
MGTGGTIFRTPVLTRPAPPPPPRRRHAAAGMRCRPDRGVVLATGERAAVGVGLRAEAAGRPGGEPRRSRDGAGDDKVLWLVPAAGVEEPLWAAIAEVDPEAELMAVERLPAAALRYAGG